MTKRIETGRVCAICGKTRSPSGQKDTYGFKTILSRNGIIKGDKAHRECVQRLASARKGQVLTTPPGTT
jgi:hypothetical protein